MDPNKSAVSVPAKALIDLHLHTSFSDGEWALEDLLDHLVREGFSLAAITDHDRTDTSAANVQAAERRGLQTVTGVEMTSSWQGEMVDLLCLGFDPDSSALGDLAQDLLSRQQENTREIYHNLIQQGCSLPEDALTAALAEPGLLQPLFLVSLLKEMDCELDDRSAEKLVISAGYRYEVNQPAAIFEAAHRSGAVCLLAHPGRGHGWLDFDSELLDQFRSQFPLDGLEAHYPLHTEAKTDLYLDYAGRHGLLISAGSDSHGPDGGPIKYQAELCRKLLERLGVQIKP